MPRFRSPSESTVRLDEHLGIWFVLTNLSSRIKPYGLGVPRRSTPDALAEKIGARVRGLRQGAGLTLEQLAYQSELGSKGHLSDIEHGRVRPTVHSLLKLADLLEVELLDLVTFPEASPRQKLVDLTRHMKPGTIRRLIKEVGD